MSAPAAARRSREEVHRTLDSVHVEAFYDWFGRMQDWQRFYERPAERLLVRNGEFETASAVFELGCGTGALAERLLATRLPPDARYLGVDLSAKMVALARRRLARFSLRAEVRRTAGASRFSEASGTFDRFLSTYVLDLLSPGTIRAALDEALRLLDVGGLLCVLSLTYGDSMASRALVRVWQAIHRIQPILVGGCRPIDVRAYVDEELWDVRCDLVESAYAVPTEVLVARKRG